tara:strand:- start:472 stop:798 length:327 start_codon:yes stop_codon:yes gene_type:complete
MPKVKKTRTTGPRSSTFTTSKDTSTGEKKKIVSYVRNEDGGFTKTVTKTKDEDYLAGSKKRPVSKSSSKVKREKTISAEKAARQKARRDRRIRRNEDRREGQGPRLTR